MSRALDLVTLFLEKRRERAEELRVVFDEKNLAAHDSILRPAARPEKSLRGDRIVEAIGCKSAALSSQADEATDVPFGLYGLEPRSADAWANCPSA